VVVIGVALPLLSTVFGLYDTIQHWGKLVHARDGLCATFVFGLLFFGWRDFTSIEITDEFAVLMTIFAGIAFGVLWEIVEFVRDWVAYSDLQKSNMDTMTDFLFNDVAAVLAALLVVRIYRRLLGEREQVRLGQTAEWLVNGPSRALDRHGLPLTLLTLAIITAAVASLWFAGRPLPGIPIP
jgi:hypothetical protein